MQYANSLPYVLYFEWSESRPFISLGALPFQRPFLFLHGSLDLHELPISVLVNALSRCVTLVNHLKQWYLCFYETPGDEVRSWQKIGSLTAKCSSRISTNIQREERTLASIRLPMGKGFFDRDYDCQWIWLPHIILMGCYASACAAPGDSLCRRRFPFFRFVRDIFNK